MGIGAMPSGRVWRVFACASMYFMIDGARAALPQV
jgi:hypothetical protein